HHIEMFFFPIFQQNGINGNSFKPPLERSLKFILVYLCKNGDETVVQIVFCLLIVSGIFKANAEQSIGIFPVQLFLCFSIALFAIVNEFFQAQNCWLDFLCLFGGHLGIVNGNINLHVLRFAIFILSGIKSKMIRIGINYYKIKIGIYFVIGFLTAFMISELGT